jgi:hypothetical protein
MTTSPPGPAHHPSPAASRAELAVFDGFPYLVSRVVPAMYHFTLLPGGASEADLIGLARAQWRANRLAVCLVAGLERTLYINANGRERLETIPPMGGVPIAGRLRPPTIWAETPELQTRQQRLAGFIEAREPKGGSMLGDLTKGGREATADEVARLAGTGREGIPRGLESCPTCYERRGDCLDRSPTFFCRVVTVHCRCANDNRCAACGQLLYERKLNANYYETGDGHIWHVPGFCAFSHRCPPVSAISASDPSTRAR